MEKIIIVYSTTDNYTIKICNKIKDVIEQKSNSVTLLSIDSEKINLNQFDKIIIGASIRYGKHNKKVYEFIKKNQEILEEKKKVPFSL